MESVYRLSSSNHKRWPKFKANPLIKTYRRFIKPEPISTNLIWTLTTTITTRQQGRNRDTRRITEDKKIEAQLTNSAGLKIEIT